MLQNCYLIFKYYCCCFTEVSLLHFSSRDGLVLGLRICLAFQNHSVLPIAHAARAIMCSSKVAQTLARVHLSEVTHLSPICLSFQGSLLICDYVTEMVSTHSTSSVPLLRSFSAPTQVPVHLWLTGSALSKELSVRMEISHC